MSPMPEASTVSRDTPKSRRTRARILEEAVRVIAENGYAATTNAAVAEETAATSDEVAGQAEALSRDVDVLIATASGKSVDHLATRASTQVLRAPAPAYKPAAKAPTQTLAPAKANRTTTSLGATKKTGNAESFLPLDGAGHGGDFKDF